MPSAPVTAIASTMAGNDRKVSMMRLMMSSIQPPKIAGDQADRQADQDRDADREQAGIDGGRRAVDQAAENMSRPRSSVPSRCAGPGGASMLLTSCAVGA